MEDDGQNYSDIQHKVMQDAHTKDHLLQWMEISVSEPEKRIGPSSVKMQDSYVVYLVEAKVTDETVASFGNSPTAIWRRYSEFELLHNYLEIMYPAIVVPPLPEKRVSHAWQQLQTDRFDADFIERRRMALENFLLRVASHTSLSHDPMLLSFLSQADGWTESVHDTDFQSKAEWKLRALSATYRLNKPDRHFEELRSYSTELQTHVNSILKIRARLADRLYGMHKVHANYGRVFSEWSGIEKEMADGLQTAGHYMDVYASSIDALLEEEEQFADHLKEYSGFADSLRTVCRKQELMQLDLEKAEEHLSYKASQRDQPGDGRAWSSFSLGGVRTRLFGTETEEQREQRLRQLEEQIAEAEEQVRVYSEDAQRFVTLALRDVDRFKRQKAKDLKDAFTNYAIMQIHRCRKGIAVWQNAKEAFGRM